MIIMHHDATHEMSQSHIIETVALLLGKCCESREEIHNINSLKILRERGETGKGFVQT